MITIDWRTLFISAEGRLARAPFWVGSAIFFTFWALYELLTGATLRLITGWIVYPALIFFGVCLLSKRFHDRGRSGWFAAPVVIAWIGLWPWPRDAIDFLFLLVVGWSIVELWLMTGEQGANRYGPNPVRPLPA